MLRQRLLSISLVIWLILLFNVERYDLLGINLPTILYIVSAAAVVAVLLVPDFILIRWYILLTPIVLAYGTYRYITIENTSTVPSLLFIIVECILLSLTFFLGWLISKQVADTERTYDALVMNSESSRTLDPVQGEEVFNQELFRARQYSRPVTMLVVKPPTLRELTAIYENHLSYQVSLQHRYIKSRVAQLSEALLYSTDPITTNGDNVVICLPETDASTALTLARRIAAVIHASLGIEVEIGVVELSKEMPLYNDMLIAAESNMYTFVNTTPKDDDSHKTNTPSGGKFVDDDTIPIPLLDYEDTNAPQAPIVSTPIAQEEIEAEPELVSKATPEKTISLYERFVAALLGTQLLPLNQLQIKAEGISKNYYNPDFWVNRLPYQSRTSRIIYRYIKRALDVTLILLASPILVPVCSLIALLIYLDDKGAVLYSQERTGIGNHPFRMWKFRSMIVDANDEEKCRELGVFRNERGETVDAEGNKLINDPRITRIGKFIRKTSLDEIPQLWNIFMGDMSLVGPRPTSFGVEKYNIQQTHRLSVKPGLTGLWQVYDRGDTDFANRLIWDMRYIDKMCLWLDLQVLFLTFTRQVLKRKGA
ncbi:MAG: hypothetical protein Phog2KO_20580 [Phototrophicaceae bacterium]